MFIQVIILLAGAVLLYIGSEALVKGSSSTALLFAVKPVIVGLTIVSLATSAPELLVSLVASIKGSGDISIGNILGSNVINIALVLGLTALISKVEINRSITRFELPYMVGVSGFFWFLCLDCRIGVMDGVILLSLLGLFLLIGIKNAKDKNQSSAPKAEKSFKVLFKNAVLIIAGIVGLAWGADLVVQKAIFIAQAIGLTQAFIGISVVAVGTSLPELATSVVAAAKGESDISVGNIVGSNLFNICLVMGSVGILNPAEINCNLLYFEIPFMILLAVILYIVSFLKNRLDTITGTAFIVFFFAYIAIAYFK
ncbi:MAG: calcium/sodium antiporter [Desulfarculaceae bacterium]|nr:calcium/sodium antiporter [Desulfarculaceae bacterium]